MKYSEVTLEEVIKHTSSADAAAVTACQKRWDSIAKPLHSLGWMEEAVARIAGAQHSSEVHTEKKVLVVMCADNGIVEEGVTQTGQEVTAIVAENFLDENSCAAIICRMTGAKPPFPCHAALCVYFALRMVYQYRRWSSDPQLQDYCFTLFALMALMLSAYQQAAFDAGIGSHRALWFLSLAAVFLCCPAMYGSRDWVLLLTCGVWAFTNLTVLSGKTRRRRPAMKLDEEPPRDA